MLNRLDPPGGQLATVRYAEADFQVLSPGNYVVCAITGKPIPLDELKYWSWQRQEAYVDAQSSLQAEREAGNLA
ncbi:MAG: DUF2093 domain-containing protein [Rhizobiaceae bacterium]|nr:DUF2093 domain-containing protein [Hyphomicrobiales bacterium]NRB32121.1 DUF2093 domain-containing protein [Rhizobiaceae bacterium]